nr:FkbM family methyltransferase [Desulfatitalea alkaliphila]
MVQLFRTLIGSNDVVADIGANIGMTAILFASLARKVFAFEPSPSTYKILIGNLFQAGANNVEAFSLGFGSIAESLTITFAINNRSGGFVSNKIRIETGHVTENIRIDTVDHYFGNAEIIPNFLKIDVEGFELDVIKGGMGFLQKHRPTVVMEMNHFCLDVLQRITIPDFLDFMRSAFPYLFAIDTDNSTIIDLHDADRSYYVMHEHVVRQRFPNIVGGFDQSLKAKLNALSAATSMNIENSFVGRVRSVFDKATGLISQSNSDHKTTVTIPNGSLKAELIPSSVQIGQVLEIPVTLTNESNEPWDGSGIHPVFLSYHWQNIDGSFHAYEGLRTQLSSQVVPPGESVQDIVKIVAPSEKGDFKLILTVVQEGICWFEDMGFKCVNASVAVV